jgi:hypothetical protein
MNINDLINKFVDIKARKESLASEIKTCNEDLAKIEADIMEQMSNAGISQAGSDKATCFMKSTPSPSIVDWNAFYSYVAETKQFELLHKRLSSTVFRERWDAGETIPGTKMTPVWELSVRRK